VTDAPVTYYEIGKHVEAALIAGHGLNVETDPGEFYYEPDELRTEWDDLAPGEPFRITPCLNCHPGSTTQTTHVYEPAATTGD